MSRFAMLCLVLQLAYCQKQVITMNLWIMPVETKVTPGLISKINDMYMKVKIDGGIAGKDWEEFTAEIIRSLSESYDDAVARSNQIRVSSCSLAC